MNKKLTKMGDEFIERALSLAAADYHLLMIKRSKVERELAEIDREAAKLSLKVVSLAALCDDIPNDTAVNEVLKEVSKMGLTDAVRSVLRASGDWMTPKEVRDQIAKLGFNLSKYQNPLASIHTILNRLDKEVEGSVIETPAQRAARQRGEQGTAGKPKFLYRWKGRVETVWDRLRTLPRDKADEAVKETAESITKKQMRRIYRKPREEE